MSEEKEEISRILKELENVHYPSGTQFTRLQRYKAVYNQENSQLESIYNLVQSHSPGLRYRTVLRYEKLLFADAETMCKTSLDTTKEGLALKCPTESMDKNIKTMLEQIKQMPKEWTLIQLTPQYNPLDNINEDNNVYHTNPIHISIFNCGQIEEEPFLMTIDVPRDSVNGNRVELVQEMMSIIMSNKDTLSSHKQKSFKTRKEKYNYFYKRETIEERLMIIIKDIQNMWLKEWRCLLSGKYVDKSLEEKIKVELKKFFQAEYAGLKITSRIISILTYVIKSILHLSLMEIKRAVQWCFPKIESKSSQKNIVQFVRGLGDKLIKNRNTKKHPIILILDESLDCLPWEMIDVLKDEPVTRVPSLHFIYTLFKEHEKDIVDGHKILSDYDNGAYIVNPDTDLKNMEVRMVSFLEYWTPKWNGVSGRRPSDEETFNLITSSNIFSYNGHGSGNHLVSLDKIQRTHVKAVVFLFGCGSVKINRSDPQVEMHSPYHMYLIARCPCIVGMLWEVTDLDTDKLTTELMSQWIPSEAPIHWKFVDKIKWKNVNKNLEFVKDGIGSEEINYEPELLRALSSAKKSVSYYGTKAACVVRGLPVKIRAK